MIKAKVYGEYPQDEDKFAGEYIAIVENKIVAHGKEPDKVIKTARKIAKESLLTKVPDRGWKEAMVLCPRLDVFDHFDVEFKQKSRVIIFRQ